MKLLDANVAIYAVDRAAEHHGAARTAFQGALDGAETLLIPWISALAFVRLTTHPRVLAHPLEVDVALRIVDDWLARPNVRVPEPDAQHGSRMRELLRATGGRGGNLVNDAHLAALAVQWDATVLTFDHDFGRFPGVRWEVPPRPAN